MPYSLLFTGKKDRRAAKPGHKEIKSTIKSAPEETEVTNKPAPEEKGTDSEGMLKKSVNK